MNRLFQLIPIRTNIIKHYIFKWLILIVIYMDFYLLAAYIFGIYQLYIYIWNLSAVYLYLDSYLSAVYKFRLLPFSFINIWTPTYQLYIFGPCKTAVYIFRLLSISCIYIFGLLQFSCIYLDSYLTAAVYIWAST